MDPEESARVADVNDFRKQRGGYLSFTVHGVTTVDKEDYSEIVSSVER